MAKLAVLISKAPWHSLEQNNMRFKQLVERNYEGELEDAIVTLLTAIGAEGINTVDTDQLVLDLQNQGFSINKNSLFSTLNGLPIVANANSETIQIRGADMTRAADLKTRDREQSKITKDAQKQAKKDLGL